MSDFDPADADVLKRHVFWTHIDATVITSVREFAYHARHVLLPQFKGSDAERLFLIKAIENLSPTVEILIEDLVYLKRRKPERYNNTLLSIQGILSSYNLIGIQHAFTKAVELAALQPIKEQRAKGGRKSAEVKYAASVAPWHVQFDPIAIRLRAERPNLTNAALIRAAVKEYGESLPVIPGPRQLSAHLNHLIEREVIAAGTKDGRGRHLKKPTS